MNEQTYQAAIDLVTSKFKLLEADQDATAGTASFTFGATGTMANSTAYTYDYLVAQ